MTEGEWLGCTDPTPMGRHLQREAPARKARLFFCACCRHIWEYLTDQRCRDGVAVAESFADGGVSAGALAVAHSRADAAADDYINDALNMAEMTTAEEVRLNGWIARTAANHADGDLVWYCEPLRCIFGNPFRPLSIHLAWLTPTVTTLAEAAYEERTLPSGELDRDRLAVLSDALEEAGCDDAEILGHLRGPGPHVRGCWVVDLLLGKG